MRTLWHTRRYQTLLDITSTIHVLQLANRHQSTNLQVDWMTVQFDVTTLFLCGHPHLDVKRSATIIGCLLPEDTADTATASGGIHASSSSLLSISHVGQLTNSRSTNYNLKRNNNNTDQSSHYPTTNGRRRFSYRNQLRVRTSDARYQFC